jgi:hypothetical protein
MSEETAVQESSAIQEAPVVEVERGPLVNLTSDQRAEFRRTGELPEAPKKEESAPSSEAKPEAESSTAPEAEKKQQEKPAKPKQTAEERIAQLEATIEKIKKGAGIEKAKHVEPPTTKVEQPTRPKPTADDKNEDGSPKYGSYEDFVEDLADWKAEQRWAAKESEQAKNAQAREIGAKVEAARDRYENFDETVVPFVNNLLADASIPNNVKRRLNNSKVFADLAFVLAGDPKFMDLAKDEDDGITYIVLSESLIKEELAGKSKPKGEEKPESPAKPQTAAPKPPSEVGGRAASPGDALESAAKANDFRSFKAEANRRALAKLKT